MILVYDTETTGLTLHPNAPLKKQPKIIEFGAVLLDPRTGSIEEEISIMVNPGEPLTDEIIKITGITDADLIDAAPFSAIIPQLRRLFSAATTVIAHNLPFDKAMMKNELIRADCLDFPWPTKELCTVGIYKEEWGRNPKLIELYEAVMSKPLAQTHRALDDVIALVDIIQREEIWRLA